MSGKSVGIRRTAWPEAVVGPAEAVVEGILAAALRGEGEDEDKDEEDEGREGDL